MKLADFYAAVGPYLHGRRSHEQAAALLWPGGGGRHAERLEIYGRLCAAHRRDVLALYEETCAQAGEAWERVVDGFFRDHPMSHPELSANGRLLPEWLERNAALLGLPAWLANLADHELWLERTRLAPDDPRDAPGGPLRLASTVELRPYAWDVLSWHGADPRPQAPAAGETLILYWRDADLDPCACEPTPADLVLLQRLAQPELHPGPLDAPLGALGPADLREALDELREVRIVLGDG